MGFSFGHRKRTTAKMCLTSDKPVAGLLKDLKERGLLDSTLVVWGGEFGRTPMSEKGDGRDHNAYGFTMWMAGGGVRGGQTIGKTDEIGLHAIEDRLHVHDLHATILHMLGVEPLEAGICPSRQTRASNAERRKRLQEVAEERLSLPGSAMPFIASIWLAHCRKKRKDTKKRKRIHIFFRIFSLLSAKKAERLWLLQYAYRPTFLTQRQSNECCSRPLFYSLIPDEFCSISQSYN